MRGGRESTLQTITIQTMETICLKCDGSGELECCECNQSRDCPDCDGEGTIECCISDWDIPTDHKQCDALTELKDDAERCISDHAKLVSINPRAKESYDSQLASTLNKINTFAKALL